MHLSGDAGLTHGKPWMYPSTEEQGEAMQNCKIIFLKFLFIHIWVLCLHLCLCTMCMSATYRGSKKVLDPLDLELQMTVNCQESNLKPLEDKLVLLTTEPSLLKYYFLTFIMWGYGGVCVCALQGQKHVPPLDDERDA